MIADTARVLGAPGRSGVATTGALVVVPRPGLEAALDGDLLALAEVATGDLCQAVPGPNSRLVAARPVPASLVWDSRYSRGACYGVPRSTSAKMFPSGSRTPSCQETGDGIRAASSCDRSGVSIESSTTILPLSSV